MIDPIKDKRTRSIEQTPKIEHLKMLVAFDLQ
jgi:hypothetical protein